MDRIGILLVFFSMTLHIGLSQSESVMDKLNGFQDSIAKQFQKMTYRQNTNSRDHDLYLKKDWQTCVLLTTDQTHFSCVGRYNILNQSIEVMVDGEIRALRPDALRAISVGGHILIPTKYTDMYGLQKKTYMELLAEGHLKLLKRHFVDSQMESGNALTLQYTGEKSFFIDHDYYIASGHSRDTALKMDLKPRQVLEIMQDKKQLVESFLKAQNIRLRKEKDLIACFDFYNSLDGSHDQRSSLRNGALTERDSNLIDGK